LNWEKLTGQQDFIRFKVYGFDQADGKLASWRRTLNGNSLGRSTEHLLGLNP